MQAQNSPTLQELLAIKKAQKMLSSSAPLALVNFDAISADTELWASFPKSGLSPNPQAQTEPLASDHGPEFQWSAWAVIPWADLAGGADAASRLPPGSALSLLRAHFESHGCEVEASCCLCSADEPPMPCFSLNLGDMPPGASTHQRLRQMAMDGPLAFLGRKAALCFESSPGQATYSNLQTTFRSYPIDWNKPSGHPQFPSPRAARVTSWSGCLGVVKAATMCGLTDNVRIITELSQLENAAKPGAEPRKSPSL